MARLIDYGCARLERARDKYRDNLRACPSSGQGKTEFWLMSTASRAAKADIPLPQAEADMVAVLGLRGERKRAKVRRALDKAFQESANWRNGPRRLPCNPPPTPRPSFARYAQEGFGFDECTLWESSPWLMPGAEGAVRIDWPPGWEDAVAFVRAIFEPGDWVLCLHRENQRAELGRSMRRRDDWLVELERLGRAGAPLPVLIAPNPFSGVATLTGEKTLSLRAQGSVASFRHMVAERDTGSLAMQMAFWGGWGRKHGWGRVQSVVHSGHKSLHVLLRVNARDRADWDTRVAGGDAREFAAMGFDPHCTNPIMMTRLPGAVRCDRKVQGVLQKLLFLRGHP
jgi:hypothetical protein